LTINIQIQRHDLINFHERLLTAIFTENHQVTFINILNAWTTILSNPDMHY